MTLTVVGVQQTEQRVQQVSYDGAELLCGRVLDHLQSAGVLRLGQDFTSGSERHPQTLHGVMGQVQLELQLDTVLVR